MRVRVFVSRARRDQLLAERPISDRNRRFRVGPPRGPHIPAIRLSPVFSTHSPIGGTFTPPPPTPARSLLLPPSDSLCRAERFGRIEHSKEQAPCVHV